jgi:hypothetical protein
MPIIITPTGPVPMHMVTIPITRDRAAGGASVRIKVVCMFEKAAVPSPPISNATKAGEYRGDSAIAARPTRNSSDPRSKARCPLKRSPTGRQREHHTRGAGQAPVAAGGRMQASVGLAAPGAHSAGDAIHVEHGLGARRGKCGCGLLPILLLQRRLQRAQFICVHRVLIPLLRP